MKRCASDTLRDCDHSRLISRNQLMSGQFERDADLEIVRRTGHSLHASFPCSKRSSARTYWTKPPDSNRSLPTLQCRSEAEVRSGYRSLFATPIPAGKGSGGPRDRAGIFGDDHLFFPTETGRFGVARAKGPENQRLFHCRRKTVFAQDCVVADAVQSDRSPEQNSRTSGKNGKFALFFPHSFTNSLKL
jgi:hypothetical protein